MEKSSSVLTENNQSSSQTASQTDKDNVLLESQAVLQKMVADVELADLLSRNLSAEQSQQRRLEELAQQEPTLPYQQDGELGDSTDDGSAADSAIFDYAETVNQELADKIADSFPFPPETVAELDAVDRFAEVKE